MRPRLTLPEPEPPRQSLPLRLLRTGGVVLTALALLTGLGYAAVALVTPSQPPGSVPVRSAAGAAASGPPPGIVFLDVNHLSMTGYRPALTAALSPQESYTFAPDPSGRVLVTASGQIVDPAVPAAAPLTTTPFPSGFDRAVHSWADGGRSLLLVSPDRLVLWSRASRELRPLGAGSGERGYPVAPRSDFAADPVRAAAVAVVPGKVVFGSYGPFRPLDRVEYRSLGGRTRVLLTAQRFRQLVGLPRASDVVLSVNVSGNGEYVALSGSGLDPGGNNTPGSVVVLHRDGRLAAVVRSTGGRSWFADAWSPASPALALTARVNDVGGNPTEESLYLLDLDRSVQPTKVDLPLPPPDPGGATFLGTVSWSPDGNQLVAGTTRAWFVVGFAPYAVSTFISVPGNPVGWLRLPSDGR